MKVSIVIPCYNVEGYVEECLDSVYAQTYPSREVICVDNDSTDGTWRLLQRLQTERYPDLILLQESTPGAPAARNAGLRVATGNWIQFLDADDLLCTDKLAHQIGLLASKPNAAFVAANYQLRKFNSTENVAILRLVHDKFTAAFTKEAGITSSNLWSRDHLIDIGGWSPHLKSSQEADLMFRLVLKGGDCIFDDSAKTIIRERESGQISQSDPGERWLRFVNTRVDYIQQLKLAYPNVYQEKKDTLLSFLLSSLLILVKHRREEALKIYEEFYHDKWVLEPRFGVSRLKAAVVRVFGLGFFG